MRTLSLALYCEGATDYRFLPPIISKTARWILDEHQRAEIDVPSLRLIEVKRKKRHEAILQAAREAYGNHALIVHADADHPQADEALQQRYIPGCQLVQRAIGDICKDLLPIIPIQAIEAWMLADYELLLTEIGTKMHPDELGIPEKASQVETISKPKRRLEAAVSKAYAARSKRRRGTDIDFLYEPVGRGIRLARLRQVSSYQQFVEDLTHTLKKLNVIPEYIHEM